MGMNVVVIFQGGMIVHHLQWLQKEKKKELFSRLNLFWIFSNPMELKVHIQDQIYTEILGVLQCFLTWQNPRPINLKRSIDLDKLG